MLNRESLFRGDAALTARQRQTAVFVGGIVVVLGAIVLSFTGLISALIHRDDPLDMQAVASEGTATTAVADGSADAGFDRVGPDVQGAASGAAAPGDGTNNPAVAGGKFTGTYKPSNGASPSPLSPTATTAAGAPAGDPGPTTPTTPAPGVTTLTTAAEPSTTSSTASTSSSTTTTRAPTTTTTTRVTVTEATVPPTTAPPTTAPPTTAPPTTAPPTSLTAIPGPVA